MSIAFYVLSRKINKIPGWMKRILGRDQIIFNKFPARRLPIGRQAVKVYPGFQD